MQPVLLLHEGQFYQAKGPKFYSDIFEQPQADKCILFQDDCKTRTGIPALPFSKSLKTVEKPLKVKLLPNPRTIGEQLKNRRLELGFLQKEVAEIIGVCEDSITLWENNRIQPSVTHYPKIIEFLGYMPFAVDEATLGGQIKLYRYLHGLTKEELANKLNINKSTLYHYEKNKHKPSYQTLNKVFSFFEKDHFLRHNVENIG